MILLDDPLGSNRVFAYLAFCLDATCVPAGSLLCAEDTSSPHLVRLSIETRDRLWVCFQITAFGGVKLVLRQIKVVLTVTDRGRLSDLGGELSKVFLAYKEAQFNQWPTLSRKEKGLRAYSFPHVADISDLYSEDPGLIDKRGLVPADFCWRNYGSIYEVLNPSEEDLFADDDPEDEVPLVDWSIADKLHLQSATAST